MADKDNINIMIIDNDEASCVKITHALADMDVLITQVDASDAAIGQLKEALPDAIILDVDTPGIDGAELCKVVRGLPGGDYTPIIMATAADDIASINEAFLAGASDFITKPINLDLFPHRLKYVMRASRESASLKKNQLKLSNVKKTAKLADWTWDPIKKTFHWSDEVYAIFERSLDHPLKQHTDLIECVFPEDQAVVKKAYELLFTSQIECAIEYRVKCSDGKARYIFEQANVIPDDNGQSFSIIGTIQDITERKLAEERIRFLAFHDALTGLSNRSLFIDHLELALQRAEREGHMAALLFLDLDNFKHINDSFGHNTGDELLKLVANRLTASLRASDTVCRNESWMTDDMNPLARFGGDEFVVLLQNDIGPREAALVANRILNELNQLCLINDHEVLPEISIGIALYPADGTDASQLLKHADIAMYAAKAAGKNTFNFFNDEMNNSVQEKAYFEAELHEAIARNELSLCYQPKIDIQTQKIVGVEALLRWHHPKLGLVKPERFIPIAEQSNLMIELGDWVIEKVCQQIDDWLAKDIKLGVAINISPQQFYNQAFVQTLMSKFNHYDTDVKLLTLEITESVLMTNDEETISMLQKCKDLGLAIHIDDFGVGYSSLRYLSQFPLDVIKIDRCFVECLPDDDYAIALIRAIIALAEALDLSIIAEGVETKAQMRALAELNCHIIQGYYFSEPVSANEIEALVADDSKIRLLTV